MWGTGLGRSRSGVLKRPGIITLLAVLQLIGATIWLLAALGMVAADVMGSSRGQGEAVPLVAALLLGALGAAQLFCGIGLLKLKPYGRTLQLVFAWIGLIGIPIGTIISILILVYLYKPGIKALFSGKEISEFSADELAQVAAVTQSSAATAILVVVVAAIVVVFMIGVVAAIAIPGPLRPHAGNEASAIGSLRAINSGQASYASSCAAGGYAVTLDDLATPPSGSGQGFISPDLRTNGVAKSGYTVRLARDAAAGVTDIGTAAATCNASTRTPASSYFASAEPVSASTGTRYFATDTRGIIFYSTSPIANPIVESVTVRAAPVERRRSVATRFAILAAGAAIRCGVDCRNGPLYRAW